MPILENKTKRILANGGMAIGIGIRALQTVEAGLMARAADFDFIFIDREHSTMELSRAGEICAAALSQGVTPLVRSAGLEAHHYAPLFDCGAQGVVVPHISTPEEAKAVVDGQKFPPIGTRSMSRSSVLTGYETMEIEDITAIGNAETMAIALVETGEGVRNAGAIASVEGLDAIMIGASDLCIDLGLPGKFDDPMVVSACADVIAACVSSSKPCGIAGVRSDALLRHFIGLGARMVHAGTDAPILVDAFRSRSRGLRQMWSELR